MMKSVQTLRTNLKATLVSLSVLVTLAHSLKAVEYLFPTDSGVVNVRTDLVSRGIHTSNAAGNGSTDDRAAIQAAINWALGSGRYSTAQFLYFPNGTYLISDTIQSRIGTSGFSSGWRAGMILIGQSRNGTIIKLQNNASGFTNASSRKSMIITGSENPNTSSEAADGSGNEAFRHQIHNMTIDVGSGNVGAVAIDFNVSNRGCVKDVLITSSDSSKRGLIGLELRKNGDGVGPLLIKNVEIDGFDVGIQGQNSTFSSTFENITLKNQKVAGVLPGQSMFTFRNLDSDNSVPVINASSNIAHVTVIGGDFIGGASANSAVINNGKVLLRDISSSGYGKIVDNNSGGASDVTGSSLDEFTSHPVETLFGSAATTTLRLPIEETPVYNNNNFSEWANVVDFGATTSNSTDDDRAAIQAAIDSGAKVVYFPIGTYHVGGQLIIRDDVRMLTGFESALRQKSGFSDPQLIRFDSTETVVIRNMNLFGKVTHNSAGALALVHCDFTGSSYSNTTAGTGKTFIEDCIAPVIRISGSSHRLWARQLNTEHNITEFQNDGATAWILGWKTEQQYNMLEAINGGETEIFGAHFWANNNAASSTPAIKIVDSTVSINFGVYQSRFPLVVQETVNGVTNEALRDDLPTRGNGNSVPLFVAGARTVPANTTIETGDVSFGSDILSYGNQDISGGYAIENNGSDVSLAGNTWKIFPLTYTVTPSTMMEVTVEATDTGEILGIGLDEDTDHGNDVRLFQLGGSQNWSGAIQITPTYTAGSGPLTYIIPIGGSYTGSMNYLAMVMDDDGDSSGFVTFSNVRIYEESSGGGGNPVVVAKYTFDSGSLVSSDVDSASSASALSSGGGSGYSLSATALSGRLRATTTDNNPNGNDAKLSNGQYATFTVTAGSGKVLNLESFSLGTRREGSSPNRVTVYASSDGGSSFVTVFENLTVNSTSAFATRSANDLATVPELQGVSSVEFRIVYHAGSTGISNGRDDTDNIEVTASVTGGSPSGVPVTLAEYAFTSGSLASTDVDSESTASSVSSGGGSGFALSATAWNGRLRATTSDNNPNGNDAKLANGQYATFTVTAITGKFLNLESFSLGTRREGSSPDRVTVYASSNGGSSFVTVFENLTVNSTSAFATRSANDLATVPELQGVSSVEFRIVYHGGSSGISNGRDDTDNIEVVGSVQ